MENNINEEYFAPIFEDYLKNIMTELSMITRRQ